MMMEVLLRGGVVNTERRAGTVSKSRLRLTLPMVILTNEHPNLDKDID